MCCRRGRRGRFRPRGLRARRVVARAARHGALMQGPARGGAATTQTLRACSATCAIVACNFVPNNTHVAPMGGDSLEALGCLTRRRAHISAVIRWQALRERHRPSAAAVNLTEHRPDRPLGLLSPCLLVLRKSKLRSTRGRRCLRNRSSSRDRRSAWGRSMGSPQPIGWPQPTGSPQLV